LSHIAIDVLWCISLDQVDAPGGGSVEAEQGEVLNAAACAIEGDGQLRFEMLRIIPGREQFTAGRDILEWLRRLFLLWDPLPVGDRSIGIERYLLNGRSIVGSPFEARIP